MGFDALDPATEDVAELVRYAQLGDGAALGSLLERSWPSTSPCATPTWWTSWCCAIRRPPWPGSPLDPQPALSIGPVSTIPEFMAHFFSTLAPRYDLRPHLGAIRAPTLVVVGDHDWVCPPVAVRAIADGIPGEFPISEEPTLFHPAVAGLGQDLA